MVLLVVVWVSVMIILGIIYQLNTVGGVGGVGGGCGVDCGNGGASGFDGVDGVDGFCEGCSIHYYRCGLLKS